MVNVPLEMAGGKSCCKFGCNVGSERINPLSNL